MISLSSPINFLSKVQFTSNPVNFKGGIKTLSEDTFERRTITEKERVWALIKKLEAEVEDINKEKEELKPELETCQQEYEKAKKERDKSEAEYQAAISEIMPKIKERCKSQGLSDSYIERNLLSIAYDNEKESYEAIIQKYLVATKNINTASNKRNEAEIKRIRVDKNLNVRKNRIKSLKTYLEHIELNPNSAFLYNPDLDDNEKRKMLKAKPSLQTRYTLIHQAKIPSNVTEKIFSEKSGYVFDEFDGRLIIDFDLEANKEAKELVKKAINKINEKQKTIDSYNKLRETHLTVSEFTKEFGITEAQARRFIDEGLISKTDTHRGLLIDPYDDKNMELIEKHKKLYPSKSEKYFIGKDNYIPAGYLLKLGFGTSINDLIDLCNLGILNGKVEQKNDKKVLKIAVSSNADESALMDLRTKNSNCKTIEMFAKSLHVKQAKIEEAIMNGELEIVPEYIFEDDAKTVYINLKNPKNAEFIDKLFEKRLEKSLIGEKSAMSYRMSLVWAMCPQTKETAKTVAKEQGWVGQILAKADEVGEDSLSESEKKSLNLYRETFWEKAGTEEYKLAHERAKIAMKEYEKGGIEAVKDPEVRELLNNIINSEKKAA